MKLLFAFTVFCILYTVNCSKILAVFPFYAYSHHNLGLVLVKELAKRGHEITYVNPHPPKIPLKNIKDISISDTVPDPNVRNLHRNILLNLNHASAFESTYFIYEFGSYTETIFKSKNVQDLLKSNETFDLMIMEFFLNEAIMGLADHFKVPLICLQVMQPSSRNFHIVENPTNTAYIPFWISNFLSRMSYWERVQNTIFHLTETAMLHTMTLPVQSNILKKYLPDAPDIYDVMHSASIVLLNSHESFSRAIPRVPNLIQIGGYHIDPKNETSKELREFLDKSDEGVILFSLGTNLKCEDMGWEKIEGILSAFSKIKQKVIWKLEKHPPNIPDNVRIEKWVPQQDVLAHPNLVAFVSHGGLQSTIEAVYFGKPIIGVPIFCDHLSNIATAVELGFAIKVELEDLNEDSLTLALNDILSNSKYRDEAQRRSRLLRDQPLKPMDTAMYWIEYVIRHKGASHLRTAATELSFIQNSLLDVYAFLVLAPLGFFVVIAYVFSLALCRKTNNNKESRSRKKKLL